MNTIKLVRIAMPLWTLLVSLFAHTPTKIKKAPIATINSNNLLNLKFENIQIIENESKSKLPMNVNVSSAPSLGAVDR
jgi:hypothetical protein